MNKYFRLSVFQYALICVVVGLTILGIMLSAAFPPIPREVRQACERDLEEYRQYMKVSPVLPDDFGEHHLHVAQSKYRQEMVFHWHCDAKGKPELEAVTLGDPRDKESRYLVASQFDQSPGIENLFRQYLYLWRPTR